MFGDTMVCYDALVTIAHLLQTLMLGDGMVDHDVLVTNAQQ